MNIESCLFCGLLTIQLLICNVNGMVKRAELKTVSSYIYRIRELYTDAVKTKH